MFPSIDPPDDFFIDETSRDSGNFLENLRRQNTQRVVPAGADADASATSDTGAVAGAASQGADAGAASQGADAGAASGINAMLAAPEEHPAADADVCAAVVPAAPPGAVAGAATGAVAGAATGAVAGAASQGSDTGAGIRRGRGPPRPRVSRPPAAKQKEEQQAGAGGRSAARVTVTDGAAGTNGCRNDVLLPPPLSPPLTAAVLAAEAVAANGGEAAAGRRRMRGKLDGSGAAAADATATEQDTPETPANAIVLTARQRRGYQAATARGTGAARPYASATEHSRAVQAVETLLTGTSAAAAAGADALERRTRRTAGAVNQAAAEGVHGAATTATSADMPAAAAGYMSFPSHRLLVLHEVHWDAFEREFKLVEFRSGSRRNIVAGMILLLSRCLALRRKGKTGLLLAEVADVSILSVHGACAQFPLEADACNLRSLSASWRSKLVTCIVVQKVRPAPEFVFLAQGNQGFLHQFSRKRGTPQFCTREDVGKRVSVLLDSDGECRTVQRVLVESFTSSGLNNRADAAFACGNRREPRDKAPALPKRLPSQNGYIGYW